MLMTIAPKTSRVQLGRDIDQLSPRYYDTTIGRFTSRDTFNGVQDNPITLNKYAYGNDNPIMFTDPSGHEGLGAQLASIGIQGLIVGTIGRGIVGAGIGGLIGGGTAAYLHVLTYQDFSGVGSAFWNGAQEGAIWGAVIGAASINPQILAVVLTGSTGYGTGQALLAIGDSTLPARTKVAIVGLVLLQGVLARAAIQRGFTAANDPNYTGNVNVRNYYHGQKDGMAQLVDSLQSGGANEEAVARAVVQMRNEMRQESWKLMTSEQVAKLQADQMKKYGNPVGPSADAQFAKYKSWGAVIIAAFRTNKHIDSMYNPNEPVVPFAPIWDDDN